MAIGSAGSGDKTVKLWDVKTGKVRLTHNCDTFTFTVAFSADGKTFVGGGDSYLLVLAMPSGKEIKAIKNELANAAVLSKDGKTVILGGKFPDVTVLDVATGKPRLTLVGNAGEVHSVALSADQKIVVVGSAKKTITLWDIGASNK